jgi:phage-related protein
MAPHFTLVSPLRLVDAQYPLHRLVGVLGTTWQGRSHEIPWDSAGMFDRALQRFAIALSAVPGLDYCGDAITACEHQ